MHFVSHLRSLDLPAAEALNTASGRLELNHMGLIVSLIVGLFVGAVAKLVMPGRDPGGIIITALIGVAGSLLATALGRAMGWYNAANDGAGLIASILGAVILLTLYRMVIRKK